VLTANGRLMGETFTNAGPLNLVANYAPGAGKSAATVKIYEGVPQRNGTITELSSSAVNNFTPSVGKHFYYAKVTQNDGKILWSAPIWVNQVLDNTAPVVSASVSGNSGTLTLQADASDDIGVTRVDFRVDGQLKGSASSAPYSLQIASSSLSNGIHVLSVEAVDAAGNVGSASPVNFNVSNVLDVTASVNLRQSGLVYNRVTQLYSGSITLSNSSNAALAGPLQLVIQGLPAGVTLVNASGSRNGQPYISLNAASLPDGARITVPLSISNPGKLGLNYSARLYSGSF